MPRADYSIRGPGIAHGITATPFDAGAVLLGSPTVAGGSGSITHGFQVTDTNTGVTAYFDSGLGRNLTLSDLTVHTGAVSASDFVSNGGTISKRDFRGGFRMDRSNVTFVACRFVGGVSCFWSGVHNPATFNWCSMVEPSSSTASDEAINYQDYTAYRCNLSGGSDGAKINGGVTMTECFVRTKSQSAADHNDGLQSVGSYTGNTILRCNIDVRPVNGGGGVNRAIFIADASSGTQVIRDNYLQGGNGSALSCFENSTYRVTGNWFLSGSVTSGTYADRAVIPQSNILEWSGNVVVNSSGTTLSTVAIP